MVETALAVELTLLVKALRLLSGLDSEPSKLGTLRMVAVLPRACFATLCVGVGRAVVMVFIVPVEVGVRVFAGEASSTAWFGYAVAATTEEKQDRVSNARFSRPMFH